MPFTSTTVPSFQSYLSACSAAPILGKINEVEERRVSAWGEKVYVGKPNLWMTAEADENQPPQSPSRVDECQYHLPSFILDSDDFDIPIHALLANDNDDETEHKYPSYSSPARCRHSAAFSARPLHSFQPRVNSQDRIYTGSSYTAVPPFLSYDHFPYLFSSVKDEEKDAGSNQCAFNYPLSQCRSTYTSPSPSPPPTHQRESSSQSSPPPTSTRSVATHTPVFHPPTPEELAEHLEQSTNERRLRALIAEMSREQRIRDAAQGRVLLPPSPLLMPLIMSPPETEDISVPASPERANTPFRFIPSLPERFPSLFGLGGIDDLLYASSETESDFDGADFELAEVLSD
ncbi:hypothetical protein R3P38DRAFT_2848928 [Favolaschia claudopus]|uniref:Uncharacterized protein n=1 Tax=Favolaschia claudopus TaxID=2862362 RepID=A0AAW0DVT0_9AGAR